MSSLKLVLLDEVSNVQVTLHYGVFEEKNIITRAVEVTNLGENPINLLKVDSASLDVTVTKPMEVVHFHGRHNMERQYERTSINHGKFSIGSHRGTSSHQHNPFMIIADEDTTETSGDVFGMMLMYSGNFLGVVEKSQFNQIRSTLGIGRQGFRYPLNSGETFVAPEAILSFSGEGLTTLSHQYHEFIKKNVVRGKFKDTRRPVLINNWEATYFTFDEEKLLSIARDAAEVGVELLVMDDGWFGKRNDDNTGLGDWQVNPEKLPNGLGHLIEEVNKLGLKFGIWFEPEMISEDSD
ncbi:MAG: alpha-galactosidase, partial [Vagococcus sp.]